MVSGLLAAAVVVQSGGSASDPGSVLKRYESFLTKNRTFIAEFQLTEPGRTPAKGRFFKAGESSWTFSLIGPGINAETTESNQSVLEVDHLAKRYEELDAFSSGRGGSGLMPFAPAFLFQKEWSRWKSQKVDASTANSITLSDRGGSITLTLAPDGSPATVIEKKVVHGGQTTLTYKFEKFALGAVPKLTLTPPKGYMPWVNELRWPMAVGDPMPDVLGRGPRHVPWKTICGNKPALLVFIQEDDKLSDALLQDLEHMRTEITSAGLSIVRCFVGEPKNHDKVPLWIEPDGRACRALGLAGTPVMSIVKPDLMVEWTWQGYGAKQRTRALASLRKAIKH